MPRSRSDPAKGSEMPQRQLTPKGPIPRSSSKTSSSDSDPSHLRPMKERNPRLVERRSPSKTEPLTQKKLGTRIADLESQLGSAQAELKILKDQLASTEEAKRLAEDQLDNKGNKSGDNDNKQESQPATDVFEVQVETVQHRFVHVQESGRFDEELAIRSEEICLLKAKLEEKDKELESIQNENIAMLEKLDELTSEMVTFKIKETENALMLGQLEKELDMSKADEKRVKEMIEAMEVSKDAVEAEMKKMRVQTDQWRKAADAAAAMLSEGVVEKNGRKRITAKCGSMERQYWGGGMYDDDDDDDLEEDGKKGSSGSRMFGDLWRKKGHK